MTEVNKKAAAKSSLKYVKNGMTIGLGSGSTMYYFLDELGKLVESGFDITGVPTSHRTSGWAREFGTPLVELRGNTIVDMAIDGANQVNKDSHLLKGGGGSLVREKIVNASAEELIILVDKSKCVIDFHNDSLPVEVLPFGWEKTSLIIERLGYEPVLRYKNNAPFISDNGNYILDCRFDVIDNPQEIHRQLKLITGVIDTGLFIGMADRIIIGKGEGITEDKQVKQNVNQEVLP